MRTHPLHRRQRLLAGTRLTTGYGLGDHGYPGGLPRAHHVVDETTTDTLRQSEGNPGPAAPEYAERAMDGRPVPTEDG